MSFLKKLFGGGGPKPPAPAQTEEYKGFVIHAEPISDAGQFQINGRITREIDGATREHRLIRVDRLASRDEAVSLTFQKGRQIIDERGPKLFD